MFFKRTPSISLKELEGKLDERPLILDVRSPNEFRGGHIKGAVNVPLEKINTYRPKKTAYVICQSGVRSKKAAKVLDQKGFDVINVKGGMRKWAGPIKGGK